MLVTVVLRVRDQKSCKSCVEFGHDELWAYKGIDTVRQALCDTVKAKHPSVATISETNIWSRCWHWIRNCWLSFYQVTCWPKMCVTFFHSSSPPVPAGMCRSPVADRGRPGETHDIDLHLLYEEGGGQSKDTRGLVLHSKKGNRLWKNSCRLFWHNFLWYKKHECLYCVLCIFLMHNCLLFLCPRCWRLKMAHQYNWMDHLRTVWPGMGAKTCKMSQFKSWTSRMTTVACMSAMCYAS